MLIPCLLDVSVNKHNLWFYIIVLSRNWYSIWWFQKRLWPIYHV